MHRRRDIRIWNLEPKDYSRRAKALLNSVGRVKEGCSGTNDLRRNIGGYDILITRLKYCINQNLLRHAEKLKVIVSATTGLDHIDLDYATRHHIHVLSLRGEKQFLKKVSATAEHTFALILGLVRRLPWAFRDVQRGNWDRDRFKGHDLQGTKLGILGFGRIGSQVARYAKAFGMQVGYYDCGAPCRTKAIRRFRSVADLLRWTEILSVHLPLNDQTHHYLSRSRLCLLPTGALVINTSRGGILDEKAAVSLLRKKHLAGMAVDVLEHEGDKKHRRRSPILAYAKKNNNVLVTPHIGGATIEAMHKTEEFMAEKIRHYMLQLRSSGKI